MTRKPTRLPRSSCEQYIWWQRYFDMTESLYSSKRSNTILGSMEILDRMLRDLKYPAVNIGKEWWPHRSKKAELCHNGKQVFTTKWRLSPARISDRIYASTD